MGWQKGFQAKSHSRSIANCVLVTLAEASREARIPNLGKFDEDLLSILEALSVLASQAPASINKTLGQEWGLSMRTRNGRSSKSI